MMDNTPRTFVGTVALRLEDPVRGPTDVIDGSGGATGIDRVVAEVTALVGVGGCSFDEAASLLVVTAREPVERADLLDLLGRLGCRVTR